MIMFDKFKKNKNGDFEFVGGLFKFLIAQNKDFHDEYFVYVFREYEINKRQEYHCVVKKEKIEKCIFKIIFKYEPSLLSFHDVILFKEQQNIVKPKKWNPSGYFKDKFKINGSDKNWESNEWRSNGFSVYVSNEAAGLMYVIVENFDEDSDFEREIHYFFDEKELCSLLLERAPEMFSAHEKMKAIKFINESD